MGRDTESGRELIARNKSYSGQSEKGGRKSAALKKKSRFATLYVGGDFE